MMGQDPNTPKCTPSVHAQSSHASSGQFSSHHGQYGQQYSHPPMHAPDPHYRGASQPLDYPYQHQQPSTEDPRGAQPPFAPLSSSYPSSFSHSTILEAPGRYYDSPSSSQSLSPSYHVPGRMDCDTWQHQQPGRPTQPMVSWEPRAASAPSSTSSVPMFGERLQQRASMQQGNIPHIPNIVVDAVPARDHFGHSRTPPFIQSDWSSSMQLHVPSSSKKMRTNSDSAIYEAEKEQPFYKKSGYIPSSWELLSFRQSESEEHIRSTAAQSPHAEVLKTYQPTLKQRSQSASQVLQEGMSQEPMETESHALSDEALNLKCKPSTSLESPGRHSSGQGEASKPMVPFIWKFQAQKSSQSPKDYWLRRHSDSNIPAEPEDLSIPKSPTARSSTGETISEEKAEPEVDTWESGGATGSSTSGAEGGDVPSPHEHGSGLLSKRLKLKKYLQKRYQLSLESTSRHSTESDDVFSPSPGVFSSSFVYSPTLTEEELVQKHQRPSPLASSSTSRSSPKRKNTLSNVDIKAEPVSPLSSESEGESESSLFLSPFQASPRSQTNVFQFHSPASHISSESEKSDSSHALEQRQECGTEVATQEMQQDILTSTDEQRTIPEAEKQTSPSHPNVEIIRQGRLPPLASMLSHPSFTHSNMTTYSQTPPQTPPFASYQSSKMKSLAMESTSKTSAVPPAAAGSPWSSTAIPARTRSASETDKPVEPSKIIYCPFSEKVQEQRYQREMTFLCPVCGQMFPSYNYLANHMVNHLPSEVVTKGPGEGTKVHLCKVCNRSFSRSDMLTRHMRLHTGLRPYECRMCGQVFSRSDHLHTHLRTHTGEKPYRCPQCPYAAPRRDMITRHMRIHTKHFSRRGRRNSSTGSADTLHSSSFSSLESGDSDVKKRNQSLSSMGSEGSTEASPFRRSSGASIDTAELDSSRSAHWSVTSAESQESGGDFTSSRRFSLKWPMASMDSATETTALRRQVDMRHRGQRTVSVTSMDSCDTEESRSTPITMDTSTAHTSEGVEQADIQSSFQRCHVSSDKDSSGQPSPAFEKEPKD